MINIGGREKEMIDTIDKDSTASIITIYISRAQTMQYVTCCIHYGKPEDIISQDPIPRS